eukprot:366058-Chlamydomonas_euryale.AAC.13
MPGGRILELDPAHADAGGREPDQSPASAGSGRAYLETCQHKTFKNEYFFTSSLLHVLNVALQVSGPSHIASTLLQALCTYHNREHAYIAEQLSVHQRLIQRPHSPTNTIWSDFASGVVAMQVHTRCTATKHSMPTRRSPAARPANEAPSQRACAYKSHKWPRLKLGRGRTVQTLMHGRCMPHGRADCPAAMDHATMHDQPGIRPQGMHSTHTLADRLLVGIYTRLTFCNWPKYSRSTVFRPVTLSAEACRRLPVTPGQSEAEEGKGLCLSPLLSGPTRALSLVQSLCSRGVCHRRDDDESVTSGTGPYRTAEIADSPRRGACGSEARRFPRRTDGRLRRGPPLPLRGSPAGTPSA